VLKGCAAIIQKIATTDEVLNRIRTSLPTIPNANSTKPAVSTETTDALDARIWSMRNLKNRKDYSHLICGRIPKALSKNHDKDGTSITLRPIKP
jgi:hypothetical protein